MQAEYGLSDEADKEMVKRMFTEANPILLAITGVVSLLHTVFEILAFKNDIAYWKNRDSLKGISVKSLFV